MTKIERKTQKIFGVNAPSDDIAVMGSFKSGTPVYTDDIAKLQNTAYEEGYASSLVMNAAPFMEEQNSIPYVLSKQLAYTFQEGIPEYDENTTYYTNSICKVTNKLYISKTDDNQGYNPVEDTENWEELKLGGGSSGLEVCDIGTALYIDETKGLRRRLNGQIVDINTNTQAFLDKLVKIKVLTPSLFCTEEEWQAIKTASKLGQCGKFVFNYSGAEIVSVRIPAVVNINGLVDMANAGLIKDESFPNLKGTAVSSANSNYYNNTDWTAELKNYGPFEDDNPIKYVALNGGNVHTIEIRQGTFNASRSSSAYKDNAPVQQEAIQYPYFIQIATGVETEVNIKDTLELNNPFTFGINMYFKGEMENISWLKSAGQQNPKALCPDFYNWVLANANAGKDGFKLSTASDITDYDFVVNTTDETFRLPLKNGQEGVFANSVKGNGIPLGLTDGTNNAGLICNTSTLIRLMGRINNYGDDIGTSIKTGDILEKSIGITTDASKSGMVVDTTVPTGYNLYYFVGETVKNPNLIDAGRIGENLVNKVEVSNTQWATNACMPDYSAGVSITSYNSAQNKFTAPCDGIITVVYISVNSTADLPYINDLPFGSYNIGACADNIALPINKGDTFFCTGISDQAGSGYNKFYPLKGAK